jgi:hypothetical protein
VSILYQLIFVPSVFSPVGLPSSMIQFAGKYHPFSIDHPQSWPASEFTQGRNGDPEIIGMIVGKSFQNVTMAYREVDGWTLEDVAEWGVNRAGRCRKFSPGMRKDVIVSNRTEISFMYSCMYKKGPLIKNEYPVICLDYYILDGSSAYSLSFCAEEKYWMEVEPIFEQMIESFRLN